MLKYRPHLASLLRSWQDDSFGRPYIVDDYPTAYMIGRFIMEDLH